MAKDDVPAAPVSLRSLGWCSSSLPYVAAQPFLYSSRFQPHFSSIFFLLFFFRPPGEMEKQSQQDTSTCKAVESHFKGI